jgi:hypothetical protein
MKTSILTINGNVALNNKLHILRPWRNPLEKLKEFFTATFESDWEKKTGLNWQEWGKFPHL